MEAPPAALLATLMAESAARHDHLCPRQVLGVRIGLYGLRLLGLVNSDYGPRFLNGDKQLLTIVETDGCGADGIAVTTDCSIGRRTLRVLDYGKMAATFADVASEICLRVFPSPESRQLASHCKPEAASRWHAYLEAYQEIPDSQLLKFEPVRLRTSIASILSHANARVECERCGEEIINEREVWREGRYLCRKCAGDAYYDPLIKDLFPAERHERKKGI